jgi:hypothetical protein
VNERPAEGNGGEQTGNDQPMRNDAANAGASPGATPDAMAAFSSALVKAAETKPASTADPTVAAAFVLGWHMSELYERHLPVKQRNPPDLPGLGSLNDKQRIGLLVDQIAAGVEKLKASVAQAGMDSIDLTGVRGLVQAQANQDPVLAMHEQLFAELTATDFRLGKAYGLGRALADSCREPTDLQTLAIELAPYRIANLLSWLDDLASAFPPHAAKSVSKSLTRWRNALYPPLQANGPKQTRLDRLRGIPHRFDQPTLAPAAEPASRQGVHAATAPALSSDAQSTVRALRRQGELWRALLSGEKNGTDMLEINNYLDAAWEMASRTATIVRGVVRRMPLFAGFIVALVLAGVVLLSQGSTSQLVSGVTSILAAVGLTWKGFGGALGHLAGKLEQPLWGAVLDDAIADAITLLPDNKAETGGRRALALVLAAGPPAHQPK